MNRVLASVKFIAAAVVIVIAIKAAAVVRRKFCDVGYDGAAAAAHTHSDNGDGHRISSTYKSNVECYPSMSKNNTIHHCSTTAL